MHCFAFWLSEIVSNFGFRVCNFVYTWRPLRLYGTPRGVLALVETIRLGRAVTQRGEPRGVLALVETIRLGRAVTQRGEPRGISFPKKRYLFIHGIISRGEPRGIPTRPRLSCSPEALFHRASHLFPHSVIQNSTENFIYLCLGFLAGGL